MIHTSHSNRDRSQPVQCFGYQHSKGSPSKKKMLLVASETAPQKISTIGLPRSYKRKQMIIDTTLMASPLSSRLVLKLIPVLCLLLFHTTAAQKFEPYQLNGGLVCAVAAQNYVVIATDTRFMGEGGYDILSRDHIESRLWMAGDDATPLSLHNRQQQQQELDGQPAASTAFVPDGANLVQSCVLSHAPTFVGSAGCNADCEALKRYVQADLRSAVYFGECSTIAPVESVATLLSQMLYSRRGFPFYSFCVAAGLSIDSDDLDNSGGGGGGGKVYVYDAIGSYEQVAVATSGTGRELLQPILDGKFRTISVKQAGSRMTTTVLTQVDCTCEEAVQNIVAAYRSVSEREIGVGDKLVICVVQQQKSPGTSVACHTFVVPLKEH